MTKVLLAFSLIAAVAFGLTSPTSTSGTESTKPNFVVIFIDDMGYGDIGPYGSKLNRTPHLDRMASEGMKLTSFYAAPVCSASRAQLLTGCYAPRVSVPGVFFPAGPKGLNPAEHTVADYLCDLGYATMCVGKWHLGDQPDFLPTQHGFDHYFGIPYSNDMQRASLEDGRRIVPLLRDDKVAELLEDEGQRRVTREYTQEAIRFMENHASDPFFLYLPHTAMHVPLFPHEDFVGKSSNGTYGDWVEEVDWSVGQVLDAICRLKLDKKTLVLFTSDNGPWASKGDAGGVAGPLRGSKGCTLEGGVREPTIAWWPGMIEAGVNCDAISGTTDILPTLVSLAGGETRPDVKIDGCDISPLLLSETTDSPHEAWYYYQGTNLQAVRAGPWKLALTSQSLGMGIKDKPDDLSNALRLYNLHDEIGEVTNIADHHPDVVARLSKLAEKMIADIGSGKPGPGVRPAGSVENPVTLYPTQPTRRSKAGSSKPVDWQHVKLGDAFAANAAPFIAGKSFKIQCTLGGDANDGVIVSHGGSAIGYALYIKANAVVFATRHSSREIQRVSQPISANGSNRISAALSADGTMSLAVDGSAPTAIKTSGVLKNQPQEDFCIGHDNRNPLDDQAPVGRFKGKLEELQVRVN